MVSSNNHNREEEDCSAPATITQLEEAVFLVEETTTNRNLEVSLEAETQIKVQEAPSSEEEAAINQVQVHGELQALTLVLLLLLTTNWAALVGE